MSTTSDVTRDFDALFRAHAIASSPESMQAPAAGVVYTLSAGKLARYDLPL